MRMPWKSKALVVFGLIVSGTDARSDCVSELQFEDDGDTLSWNVCDSRQTYEVVDPSSQSLEIAVFDGSDSFGERFSWTRREDLPANEYEFRALNPARTIELTRRISRISAERFVQTISVSNVSSDEVLDLNLQVRLGRLAKRDVDRLAGLARQVYDFERYLRDAETDQWHLLTEGDAGTRFALYSRHQTVVLEASERLGVVETIGRDERVYYALEKRIERLAPRSSTSVAISASRLSTSTLALSAADLQGLMYSHIWGPLAAVSVGIERLVAQLTDRSGSAGLAIILLAVLIRILTVPVAFWSFRRQKEFAAISKVMKPTIAQIRKSYQGAEQSERILAVYKQHEVSPFSGLKGSVGLFIQVPFLLAVFHVTTESSIFEHAKFLWIENLALSDSFVVLPFTIPIFGNALNILPLGLGVLNVVSVKKESLDSDTSSIVPLAISLVIVVLFYTVSAALVLYWLVVNLMQIFERNVFNRILARRPSGGVS